MDLARRPQPPLTQRLQSLARVLAVTTVLLSSLFAQAQDLHVLVVVGEPGTEDYEREFRSQADAWKSLASKAGASFNMIGLNSDDESISDYARLKAALEKEQSDTSAALWLVFIGHGTHDGRETKFNLRGPDVDPTAVSEWLNDPIREWVFIHMGSASGSFIKPLSGPNRILITATKNASEFWATRFGSHFVDALDPTTADSDQDQDGQVSLLEAWLHAAKKVEMFYEEEGRIATEHSLLDDNGDGVGTRSETFEQLQPTIQPSTSDLLPDGKKAHQTVLILSDEEALLSKAQRAERDSLELQINSLQNDRESLGDSEYYERLEALLIRIASIYSSSTSDRPE